MMTEQRFLVAQLGARMHYAIPRILHQADMLERFYTDICAVKGWPRFFRAIPQRLQTGGLRRLVGRVPHSVPVEKITTFSTNGFAYALARTRPVDSDRGAALHMKYGKRLCEAIVKSGFGRATATYTFNGAGLELMQAAKKAGLKTVMEQVSAPRAVELKILADAGRHYPEWSLAVPSGPNIEAFIAREEAEWKSADLILCGSDFVKKGIEERGGPVEKCRVVPYGVDQRFSIKRNLRSSGRLRVLTVGYVKLQKGTPCVWEAARLLENRADFRMVGAWDFPKERLLNKPSNVHLVGAVPRSEILEHYRWADVFLLPSFSEGSATVTYEAMLAGLPVICTPNTGALIVDGVTGFIVPIFSVDAIVSALEKWIAAPDLLETCRHKLLSHNDNLSLDAYRARLLSAIHAL